MALAILTRSFFQQVAQAVFETPMATADKWNHAAELATILASWNPAFDRDRFLNWCMNGDKA